jgi:Uma2 family endonuclease
VPIYARNGIAEVWIVDLNHDCIHVYRDHKAAKYSVSETRSRGETISPQAFPAFAIKVDELIG